MLSLVSRVLALGLCLALPGVSSNSDSTPRIPVGAWAGRLRTRALGGNAASSSEHPRPLIALRGGSGEPPSVPGVSWSQKAESLLVKVDYPKGKHSDEGMVFSDTHITWIEDGVHLDLGFFAPVKSGSASIKRDG